MPFCRINKITTWYRESGETAGLPLIFVNSLGTDHRIWDDVIGGLGSKRRCVVFDKRGHGLSDVVPAPYAIADLADDLVALADHCGIERFAICGVSVGGMIALSSAMAAPGRVAGLVLCDTACRIGTVESWNARIARIQSAGMESIADGVMERWFSAAFRHSRPHELAGWRNGLLRTPAEGYIATCVAIRDADMSLAAKGVDVPTMVIAGAEDQSTPPAIVRALADQISGARYELIAGVGHLPCIEQPDRLAMLLDDFLETLPDE